ncbi:hypothetical protein [Alishewanella phage vB_AspM_Slickus01]|nr:hypothetical protein [Alishewanella phage vB_AspM_Slickus01]
MNHTAFLDGLGFFPYKNKSDLAASMDICNKLKNNFIKNLSNLIYNLGNTVTTTAYTNYEYVQSRGYSFVSLEIYQHQQHLEVGDFYTNNLDLDCLTDVVLTKNALTISSDDKYILFELYDENGNILNINGMIPICIFTDENSSHFAEIVYNKWMVENINTPLKAAYAEYDRQCKSEINKAELARVESARRLLREYAESLGLEVTIKGEENE